MKDASVPVAEKYTQMISALQEEFFAHEGLIKLFLHSSSHLAVAA